MIVLAANGICIGVAMTVSRAQQILDNWNNQLVFVVSQCEATNNETLTSNQVLDIIYNGIPLSVLQPTPDGKYEEVWLTSARSVDQFL